MTGYASEAVAVQIEKLSLTTDLYVSVSQPGYINGCRMPVTIDVFKAFTWAGDTAIDEEKGYFIELVHFEEDCSPLAFQELRQACYISVIDLCWGRKDYLWDELVTFYDGDIYTSRKDLLTPAMFCKRTKCS